MSLYFLNNGVLEIRNKRVSNADGSIVSGMEQVAALFPSGSYSEKWLCGWLTTGHSVAMAAPLYVEHKTKYSNALGQWITFWLLGRNKITNTNSDDYEIDLGEQFGKYSPNAALNFATHNHTASGMGDGTYSTDGTGIKSAYDWNNSSGHTGPRYLPNGANPGTAVHTYGALILSDRVVFSMDGTVLHTAMATTNSYGAFTLPTQGFYSIMSTGMGGMGGVPTPGVNTVTNYFNGWTFSVPA